MRQVTKEVLSDFVDSMQSKDLLTSVIGAVRCDAMRFVLFLRPLQMSPLQAYEDFIAVAEALVKTGVTCPKVP